jgi:hypothetical protein
MNGRMKKKLYRLTLPARTKKIVQRIYLASLFKGENHKGMHFQPFRHFDRKIKKIYKKLGLGGVNEFIQKISA